MILDPPALYALVQCHGARPGADAIAVAGALAESGGDTEAVGDNGHSHGLWQLYDEGLGKGYTVEQRRDPDFAASIMVPLYNAYYETGRQRGLTDETLARYTYMNAERPAGWTSQNPGLWSPAANRFAGFWKELMATPETPEQLSYNPDVEVVLQSDDYSCSCASTAAMLHALGIDDAYPDVERSMLGRGLVSQEQGLLVATAEPLAQWLRDRYGLPAEAHPDVDWAWVQAHAGRGGLIMGGARWGVAGHWVMVRDVDNPYAVRLANPAPGYAGIEQVLWQEPFRQMAPFNAVWVPVEEEEDMGRIAELESLVGYLRETGGTCREKIEEALATPRLPKAARDALESGALPAAQTVERGGPPEGE